MNVYSIDIMFAATAYIKADNEAEAFAIAKALKNTARHFVEDDDMDLPINGRQFDDPDLPEVSMSPAMTCYGPWDEKTLPDLVEEGV